MSDKEEIKYNLFVIKTKEDEIKKLLERNKEITKSMIDKCKHELVLESEAHIIPYKEDEFPACTLSPIRVCVECGLAEEGWGCGYYDLDDDRKIIKCSDREDCKSIIILFRSQMELDKIRQNTPTA